MDAVGRNAELLGHDLRARTVSEPRPVSTVPASVAVPSSFTLTTAALGFAATVNPIGTTCTRCRARDVS